ncbi:hypothetical protein [Pseudomonas kuykendallii]|uniref:hypothetical protein n=1 Tax=Pseudomonas kuykendallii TaxID=1007099 RepID=UPI0028D455D6|nr:hypothetical protein [Pseudomonas kuykendallii]
MSEESTVLGIDPETGKVVAAGRDDDDYIVELFRQGLIVVPSDAETARAVLFNQAGNICNLVRT